MAASKEMCVLRFFAMSEHVQLQIKKVMKAEQLQTDLMVLRVSLTQHDSLKAHNEDMEQDIE